MKNKFFAHEVCVCALLDTNSDALKNSAEMRIKMTQHVYVYLIVAALTLYAIRALPMTLIRKDIKSPFIRSFLYYVPYVTLAVMTFPAILEAAGSKLSAWAGFIVAIGIAWFDGNLFRVAVGACLTVYLAELLIPVIF